MISILQNVNGNAVILIAMLTYVAVWAVKQSKINNQYLPIVAELIGLVIGFLIGMAQSDITWLTGAADGLIAGAISVGGNELAKSLISTVGTNGDAK